MLLFVSAAMGSAKATIGTSHPLILILLMATLSLLPFVILLMTSFVRIAVVLSILKSALGTTQIPPTQIITGISLLLTCYVMAPTGQRMWNAVEPLVSSSTSTDFLSSQTIDTLLSASHRAKEPLKDFLLKHSNPKERQMFFSLALRMRTPEERKGITQTDFLIIVPSFLTSELRRAFEIGFLLFVPFLVIDMVISNILLALGMHMLSPTTVSLPFKLLLFVVSDGWQLLLRGLVESYV
jgi:type III secretion protein R